MQREDFLISADDLAQTMTSAAAPVVLDVRWTLQQPEGHEEYATGHIPGAHYVSLDTQLADPRNDDPTRGRHPLPQPTTLEHTIRSWGIDAGTPVVVYDNNSSLGAARAWWVLRWAGVGNVRVLDGGYQAWVHAGQAVDTSTPATPTPSNFAITPGSLPTVSDTEVAELATAGCVLDARAPQRFRGEEEPLDPQAGHIPGAVNAPATENVRDGFFLSTEELRQRFTTLGIDPDSPETVAFGSGAASEDTNIAVYCGSGITACHNALALAVIGVQAALYPPSWSGWSADSSHPVATA